MNNDSKPRMPFFKEFPSDELLDYRINQLSLEEFGAYQKLKFFLWNDEKLPLDFKILGKLLGISAKKFEKIWKNLNFLFVIEDENKQFIRHSDLDEQRHNYNVFIEKSRLGGRKSAQLRGKARSTDVPMVVEAKNEEIEKTNTTQQQDFACAENTVVELSEIEISQEMRDEYFDSCVSTGTIINQPAFRNYTNSKKSNLAILSFHQSKNRIGKLDIPKQKVFVCSKCGSDEIGVETSAGAYCVHCPTVFTKFRFAEISEISD